MKLHLIASQPAASTAAVTGGAASPGGTPAEMPAYRVNAYPEESGNQYVTVGYAGLMPAWTADGGAIVFTEAPAPRARLHKAGRPLCAPITPTPERCGCC